MPVILIMTQDSLYAKTRSALEQVTARKGEFYFSLVFPSRLETNSSFLAGAPIIIANDTDKSLDGEQHRVIRVPKTVDCLQGLLNIIPLQLLSYHMAVTKGFDVDFPRCVCLSLLFFSLLHLTLSFYLVHFPVGIWRSLLRLSDLDRCSTFFARGEEEEGKGAQTREPPGSLDGHL
jgi:hypothetical protein